MNGGYNANGAVDAISDDLFIELDLNLYEGIVSDIESNSNRTRTENFQKTRTNLDQNRNYYLSQKSDQLGPR